jgi:hypothetical protein
MEKNTGITEGQMVQIADLIEQDISITQANILRNILKTKN